MCGGTGGDERKIGVRLSAAKHNDKDSFASFRARKGSLWVGSEPKDTVQEEDEDMEKIEEPAPKPAPAPTKSIIKIDKIREKFEVMKAASPSASSSRGQVSHQVARPETEMETEESVSSKLEQWKRRRIERLER